MANIREIVNGTLLQSFNGKPVSLTGVISNVHNSGLSFEIRTLDDVTVKVVMTKPRTGLSGFVEVHGIAEGNSIASTEVIEFAADNQQEYDVAGHNTLCGLLNTLKEVWETGNMSED